jgi:succinate dehydrogenase / fumarate reductase cytochrome b subunit
MESSFYNLFSMLRYRGREGHWAWVLHRMSGLGVMLFLLLHITDIFLLAFGPKVFNTWLFLFKSPPFRVLEVFLIFGVLFHAVNGLRVILMDFVHGIGRYQHVIFWIEAVVVAVVFIPAAVITLAPIFS